MAASVVLHSGGRGALALTSSDEAQWYAYQACELIEAHLTIAGRD